ncbi:MAG: peptide deformylase [Chloroflexi bacterium]|nr:peptide deformylase [Chloroflexota bacterium]MDA1298103.1 peptide deformylase [Chloroflexota bacterium]
MAILPIRVFPDPILRQKARPVKRVDDAVRRLVSDMIETMQSARGVGLAAPQVGELRQVITIQVPEQDAFAMINPEITRRDGSREVTEGCLSVPGYSGLVTRSIHINARALDENGGRFKLTAEELLAQAIEHEVDHLSGIVFLDHLIAHEELHKVGTSPDEPHWHDVGYTVYAQHAPTLARDFELVEVMNTVARLSRLNAESSLSEASYDLADGAHESDLHSHDHSHS